MMKLKANPGQITPFSGRSDILVQTRVPIGANPRSWYLKNDSSLSTPIISSSDFVPSALIEHLMRHKKNSALGVKFQSGNTPPDAITNMEGAMHTFVTPISLTLLHGDYIYSYGHGMVKFEAVDGMQQARLVVVSAQIQPDFEGRRVMLALSCLKELPFVGQPLPASFSILDTKSKQSKTHREAYDTVLQQHLVENLVRDHRLPSVDEAASETIDLSQAISFLERVIVASEANFEEISGNYVRLHNESVVSLELLFNSAIHQLRNELSALEHLLPQGYVYTSDPPSIFAQEIGATMLNRLQFAALKKLASDSNLSNMRAFAFNDYADSQAIFLLEKALSSQSHVQVVPKSSLFRGPKSTYQALPGMEGSLLVIHNNSDAFGQNIETEQQSGSMDGAIGSNSSAAASLRRDRADLVMHYM